MIFLDHKVISVLISKRFSQRLFSGQDQNAGIRIRNCPLHSVNHANGAFEAAARIHQQVPLFRVHFRQRDGWIFWCKERTHLSMRTFLKILAQNLFRQEIEVCAASPTYLLYLFLTHRFTISKAVQGRSIVIRYSRIPNIYLRLTAFWGFD